MKHLEHSVIALVLQAIIGLVTGDWWIGAAAGSLLFIGREHAQAEYRNIEHHYGGRRANMPWWGGMDPRVWDIKSLLDFILPFIACVAVAVAVK